MHNNQHTMKSREEAILNFRKIDFFKIFAPRDSFIDFRA